LALAPVDIPIQVKGLSDLQKLERRMEALEKEVTRLQKTTPKAANSIKKFGGAARGASGGVGVLSKSLKSLASTIAPMLVAVAGLGAGFKTLSDQNFFEAKVRSLGVDSEDLVVSLKKVSAELKGQASVVELTGAAYDVASAGFNNAADASKVLKAASLGAVGGFSDINTVANATTSVLNAYGLSADKAGGLVDGFIQTQNDGKIVLDEYARNIGKVAPIAAALGVPLSDLNGAIAAVTANGVNAEIGITAIRSSLAKLAAPTKEGVELLGKYGVEINAATIEADGLAKTLRKLEKVTSKEDLFKIIGTEAGQAIAPLLNDLPKLERLILNQANAAGVAQKANDTAAQTIQGALKSVATAFQNVFSEQSAAAEAIIPILQALADTINAINSPAGIMAVKIGLATAGVIALTKAIVLLKATALAGWLSRAIPLIVGGKTALLGKAVAAGTLNKALVLVKGTLASMGWLAAAAAVGVLVKQQYDLWAATNDYNNLLREGTIPQLEAEIKELELRLESAKNKTVTWYESILDFVLGTDGASTAVDGLIGKIDELNMRRIQITDTDPTQGAALDMDKVNAFRDQLRLEDQLKTPPPTIQPPATNTGAEDEARELEDTAKRIRLSEQNLKIKQAELAIAKAMDPIEKLRLEAAKDILQIEQNLVNTLDGEKNAIVAANEERAATIAKLERELELSGQITQEKERQAEASKIEPPDPGEVESYMAQLEADLTNTEGMIVSLAQTIEGEIGSAMSSAITGLIDGTKTAKEAFGDMFKNIGKAFIDMATKMIAKALMMKVLGILNPGGGAAAPALPKFGPGFAEGGRPPLGQISVVGERGPELFVPDSAGTVLSNEQSKAALDTYSGGNSAAAASSGPVKAEVTYKGPTLNFNGNDYIPRSEASSLVAEGAKQGKSMAMKQLQNSRSQRQRLGL